MAKLMTRERIVEAADGLFYERGYEHTSFADIAGAVGLSRGNFYYHFDAKDKILAAVIERRMERTRALLDTWEAEGKGPLERIGCFIHILVANRAKIESYGCPVGTLNAELAKLEHGAREGARGLFTLFREWLKGQFEALGKEEAEADGLAMRVLAQSQGVAALSQAYKDQAFVDREVAWMKEWVKTEVERV